MQNKKTAFFTGLACLLVFLSARSYSFINANLQQQLIVYNVPKRQAIDFVNGRNYFFKGDADLLEDNFLQNFHLKPSRILHRMTAADSISNFINDNPVFIFNNKKIALIDNSLNYPVSPEKINTDVIILSKNAPVQIANLLQVFNCGQIVLDASNSYRKVNKWKTDAAKLGLHCFSVVDNGAFVMNMD